MKRTVIILLALCLLLSLASCAAKTASFDLSDAQSVVVYSQSGEKTEITDPDTVRQLADSVSQITFSRDKSSKDQNGFGPMIQFNDPAGNKLASFSVSDSNTINFDGYYWIAQNVSIDTDLITGLIKK